MFAKVNWDNLVTLDIPSVEGYVNEVRELSKQGDVLFLSYDNVTSPVEETLHNQAIVNYLMSVYPENIIYGTLFSVTKGEVRFAFIFGSVLKELGFGKDIDNDVLFSTLLQWAEESGDVNNIEDVMIRGEWYDFCEVAELDENNDALYDKFETYCLSEAKIGCFEIVYDYENVVNVIKGGK